MPAPKTTVWKLEPHTRAKHEILRRYLQAWTPILLQGGFPRVLYIDGFAGPGRYASGEDGSPIIAVKAALKHRDRINGTVDFLFVESKPDRAAVLGVCLEKLSIPANFRTEVASGQTFQEAFEERKQFYAARRRHLPPTFAFIDPFGWEGVPFSVIVFILGQPSCEVFITFMYEEINRFLAHSGQAENFNSFFGTEDWRGGVSLPTPEARNRFLHDLYVRQLKNAAGARYVRSFQMRNSTGLTDYYLFYATNNILGLKKMKEAMWKVDETGEFTFSDATDPNQMVLFSKEPRYELLSKLILTRFGGHEVALSAVEEFVVTETPFRETHYKQQVLKELELAQKPSVEVIDAPAGRKRGTYPYSNMKLRFSRL
jgi:three-Cys-motif partner protein